MTRCKIVRHLGPEPKLGPVPYKRKPIPNLGQVALVTGASSGLGRELAIAFSQSGHVILSGRNVTRLEETQKLCKDPANTTIVFGDLTSTDVCRKLADLSDLYGTQYLICCAGEYQRKGFKDTEWWDSERIINSNLASTIKLCKKILPVFLRFGRGAFVNINSVAGRNASPDEAAYSASKHGLSGFFKALRLELREKNIRVMDVFSGGIQTAMTKQREDYDFLIPASDVAAVIYNNTVNLPTNLQIEELAIGRFNFPKK